MKTEEDEHEQIREIFRELDAAKIITDGLIVPNIVMNAAKELKEDYRRFSAEVD